MKVIFLDHQGVMYLKNHPNIGRLDPFDDQCIKTLNSILDDETEIVISSDWKYWVPFNEMSDFYLSQGIKRPIDYTPSVWGPPYDKNRSIEILKWLESHPEVTKWVSIDDLDMSKYLSNFIYVQDSDGIAGVGIAGSILGIL